MHADWVWLDLALPLSAALLFGLGQVAWRVRTTAIGRAFVVLVCLAGAAVMVGLAALANPAGAPWLTRLLAISTAGASASVLRLGLLAIQPARRLPLLLELAIVSPALLVGGFAGPLLQAAWIGGVQALAAYGLHRVPRRSWQSFDAAIRGLRVAMLATGLLSGIALVSSPAPMAVLVAPLAHLGLAIVLYFGLPRIGLLAQDRVHHRGVLEAMSDGVLVVDLDDRLLATLEQPVTLAGQDLFISTSIGIAVFPEDGEDAEALIRNADAAMSFAKGRGRNGYSFYTAEMNRSQSHRLELETRLRTALERGQLEIHYQPILSAETGLVVAAEALVRWREAEWGYVLPDDFIPVAEETGLIVGLGQWVFRNVCEQARRWRDELGVVIRIGVNVSGKQIREPGMIEMVRQALEAKGVSPTQVELELTESTIMQDDALTVQTLRQLKEMGVGLALDDFGTDYSSLSYLRRFTIDRVKIDRTFVSDLPGNASDAALTSAIIAMAHGLQLDVVAEGVETEAQARFLELRGCDELQGYLFGRPCAADEFVDRLRAGPRAADAADAKPDESSA